MMRVHVSNGNPAMLALVSHFYQLVIMQRAPQDFPASGFLLLLVAAVHLVTGFFGHLAASGEWLYALLRSLLGLALVLAGSALLLALFGRTRRWLQTAIALVGGEALIGIASLPFVVVVTQGISNIFLELSLLMFLVWQIAFVGHVWRHALQTHMLVAVLLAVGLIVGYAWIEIQLLPFPGDA